MQYVKAVAQGGILATSIVYVMPQVPIQTAGMVGAGAAVIAMVGEALKPKNEADDASMMALTPVIIGAALYQPVVVWYLNGSFGDYVKIGLVNGFASSGLSFLG